MIQPNELRLGNLLHSNISGKDFVIDIDFMRSSWQELNMMLCTNTPKNAVAPVPLTEEWLLNKVDWNGYLSLCINSNFKLDTYGRLYYHGDYTGINLLYVHQLQNLYFALTGEELCLKD